MWLLAPDFESGLDDEGQFGLRLFFWDRRPVSGSVAPARALEPGCLIAADLLLLNLSLSFNTPF